jgi:hypothetical protein
VDFDVVTTDAAIVQMVKAGFSFARVRHHRVTNDVVTFLLRNDASRSSLAIVDINTIPDAEHLITFIKSSAAIRHTPLVTTIASEDRYDTLTRGVLETVNGVITLPCSPEEFATAVDSVIEVGPARLTSVCPAFPGARVS